MECAKSAVVVAELVVGENEYAARRNVRKLFTNISVHQAFSFIYGFFQICGHLQRPCQSLIFPISSAHAETFSFLYY